MDTNMDSGFDLDLGNLTTEDIDFSFLDPLQDDDRSGQRSIENGGGGGRAYHTKKPHKKSRAGCKNCKKRKVKCSEERPTCRACLLRREKCAYPPSPAPASPASSSSRSISAMGGARSPRDRTASFREAVTEDVLVVKEPVFRPSGLGDDVDMKMLWFYTTYTFSSFSIEGGRSLAMDHVLRVKIVEHAFHSPFLMQCLMGLSALQLQSLGQDVLYSKIISYQSKAYEGYRSAIEAANPSDFPALLACSLLMCALSSQMFREPDTKPLYIVEWMAVWRGIGLIVEIITPQSIADSGLAVLFYRPPVDLEKCAQHIPNNLLFMVSSIKPGDIDYEHQQTYYTALKYLASLYTELQHGFSSILDLRVITFFTFFPRELIPLAKEYRPRVLVILAHYLCFVKINNGSWWMQGIADREIDGICKTVGDEWADLVRVPHKVRHLCDKTDIAQTILENHIWSSPREDLYDKDRDPRIKQLKMINNESTEINIVGGKWVLHGDGIFADRLRLADPNIQTAIPGEQMMLGKNTSIEERVTKSVTPQEPIGVDAFGLGHPLNSIPSPSNKSSVLSSPSPSDLLPSGSAASGTSSSSFT